ncbi:hypothetical protein ABL78_8535 [Leptomonas seymouri]|uniref:Uncharacterized protein n=1 Tax=Leptomonas seymouri TaxID=5684 RepID=A0A0N1IGZ6_LEPSE|nr:hypothetical protein ABL78_8535 [Leptomonas seymouri]|eukprot:KPI82455.1 hypothetical protein ABL78_8535 [Leptomonas seymouri]
MNASLPLRSLNEFSARPSISSEWLIFFASSNCCPVDSVFACRSLPARSTNDTTHSRSFFSTDANSCDSEICMIACERELVSFIFVSAVCRFALPARSSSIIRSALSTWCTLAPFTYTRRRGSSWISSGSGSWPRCRGASRSRTFSMYTSIIDSDTRIVRSGSSSTICCASSNRHRTNRGATPSRSALPTSPSRLYVLPLPVCPYANRHTLKPLYASSSMGRPIVSNTSSWPPLNTWSKR